MTVLKTIEQRCCMQTKARLYGMRNIVQYEAKAEKMAIMVSNNKNTCNPIIKDVMKWFLSESYLHPLTF